MRTRLDHDAHAAIAGGRRGILPQHPRWARFLRSLRYVVVDEMHAYRGIFGSHVANVLRRLERIVALQSTVR